MQRVDNILNNKMFRDKVAKIEELEKDRIFCRHDMDHFLDVARIAALIASDEGFTEDREMIYAAALLHDIGRDEQYVNGTPHEKASAGLAPEILRDCAFDEEEIKVIVKAIADHGDESVREQKDLSGLIYRADKMSRKCYMCTVVDRCHKSPEKLVMNIKY